MVEFLLKNGAKSDVLKEDYDWRGCGSSISAFEMAVHMKDCRFAILFLQYGANPNFVCTSSTHSMRTDGSSSWSLLHTAVKTESLDLLNALLNAEANLYYIREETYFNERGYNRKERYNVLYDACKKRNIPIIIRLLDEDEKRRSQSKELVTFTDVNKEEEGHPLLARRQNGFESLANLTQNLVNRTCTYTVHEDSQINSPTDDPRASGYISPVVCVQVDETPLHAAIKMKDQDLVNVLLSYGADPSISLRYGDKVIETNQLCEEYDMTLGTIYLK
jgi:ankyrin repeat protein